MSSESNYDLAGQVIGMAMRVHTMLGPGFLESVYRNALMMDLAEAGFELDAERRLLVHYRGRVVGEFVADIIVNSLLIVELKAVQDLTKAHEVQLVNYLTATSIDEGLLLNFGAARLEFKKKFRSYRRK